MINARKEKAFLTKEEGLARKKVVRETNYW